MNKTISMADLLAKSELKSVNVNRGQEVEGQVIAILQNEIILDLLSKAEGVLQKRELSSQQLEKLKVGDKINAFVLQLENENGQVVLGLQKQVKNMGNASRWRKFEEVLRDGQSLKGKGIELNKGGLIVEVGGLRGFLPSSQVSLSQVANIEELVGQEIEVTVLEADSNQNRLIFSQKTNISEDIKTKLSKLKISDQVKGKVAAVLPFGIFVSLDNGVEGLVHISEISWEKVEDPGILFKVGDEVEAQVISLDANTGRVNLSMKQLSQDPFINKVGELQANDTVKGKILKITSMGVFVDLELGVEGMIHSVKLEGEEYQIGQEVTCLVDSIDTQKRRVNLVPFITSTKDLIYK